MKVIVRYHAAAKELCGTASEELSFEANEVSQDAFRATISELHDRLRDYLPRMRLAVNGDFAQPDQSLRDNDQIDILPPVAGGSSAVDPPEARLLRCVITEEPLVPTDAWRLVSHPSAGAVALFSGVVRDHAEGQTVARLRYEAHVELAEKEMRRILVELCAEQPSVRIAAAHRIGDLSIGDVAVVVAVSSAHRAEAFEVCRNAIDRIKETVPIWKKEWDPDGAAHWVNLDPT